MIISVTTTGDFGLASVTLFNEQSTYVVSKGGLYVPSAPTQFYSMPYEEQLQVALHNMNQMQLLGEVKQPYYATPKKVAVAPVTFESINKLTKQLQYMTYEVANTSTIRSNPVVDGLCELIPGLRTATAKCPMYKCSYSFCGAQFVINLIVHLNDHHQWSREQVADWLDLLPIDLSVRKDAA
jgi:hypothetical protein